MLNKNNKNLRRQIRIQRRQLTSIQQQQAAARLATNLTRLPVFQYSRRIALYLPNDGEIDPCYCMDIALAAGKQCYLPVLHPLKFNRLFFARYNPEKKLVANRFGILEPKLRKAKIIVPWSLNIVVLPLVAFDANCNRLGMGGGFYDRTLSFVKKNKSPRPVLIGAAHAFQQVASISPERWDIPLDMIVTDEGIFYANQNHANTERF